MHYRRSAQNYYNRKDRCKLNNELKIFENDQFGSIRTVEIDSTPYFVGKAVISHVDDEDKRSIMLDIADSQNGNVPVGQTKTTIINESGQFNVQCAMMMYQTFFFELTTILAH